MIKPIADDFNKDEYNAVAHHPLQSWQWGEARQKMGLTVMRLGEFARDRLVNVFQLTLHPLPFSPWCIGYLPRSSQPSQPVIDFLKDYGKKNGIIFFKIEPYETNRNVLKELRPSPHPLFPLFTQILDLQKTEGDLFNNLKSKTRYNIRLAQKKGVTIIEQSNDKGFAIFSRLYFETTKRQKYFGHSPHYHKIIWETLRNEIVHILIAYFQGQPIAAYELFYFDHILYYPYGGSSLEHRNVMGANLLMWEAIRLGQKLGAKKFDLWGSLPPGYDNSDSWSGFTRFKEGYGGQFTKLAGSFDLIINQKLYLIYNLLHSVRQIVLGIKV
ncbi:hypothetical protein A2966_04750 [Candidatus Roizmanbacteria bacterium RIFCSPLOWO2_01_FULL_41_22]|uniref:BioF2-like acetyltransferase domain-containing protein n=1 Tax=Candidatus Roizmanbacteria bacterium RIFCSPLOWO2_01_FULL_41_22 TaxID=1802067 RepID=A0A1F7JAZ8_9BACT|nr:MAG: hypothetical protein A2966_04750 [Candidatus Roizmanbacteria bacterium RIFCSPLOWO2_01_FULL_41_22]